MKECVFSYSEDRVRCRIMPDKTCAYLEARKIPEGLVDNIKTSLAGYTTEALKIMRDQHLPETYFGIVCSVSPAIVTALTSMIEERGQAGTKAPRL